MVTLEVSDAAGNKAHGSTTVRIYEKDGRGTARVKVADESGAAIPYALVYVEMAEGETMSLTADGYGYVAIAAKTGVCRVAAYATDYLPNDIQVTIGEAEQKEYTLTLVKDELIVGDLTVRRMTLEEMVEAGVDFSAPENYNRFVFNVSLTFKLCQTTQVKLKTAGNTQVVQFTVGSEQTSKNTLFCIWGLVKSL